MSQFKFEFGENPRHTPRAPLYARVGITVNAGVREAGYRHSSVSHLTHLTCRPFWALLESVFFEVVRVVIFPVFFIMGGSSRKASSSSKSKVGDFNNFPGKTTFFWS